MMTRKIFLSILLISILVTLVVSILSTIIFSFGGSYKDMTHEDWAKLDSMNYREARNYLKAHSIELSGFDILKGYFSSPQKFSIFIKHLFWTFIVIFITAFITAFRVLKLKEKGER